MNLEFGVLAISQNLQNSALILGLSGVVVGIILFKAHHDLYWKATSKTDSPALLKFEKNKLQRRSLVAGLISSTGCFMAAIYWVSEIRVLAILTLLMVCQLFLILSLAAIDLFSIYLRQLTKPDRRQQKKLIEEYLKEKGKL